MKMKKLLALVLSSIMAVSMLTACGGGGSGVKTTSIDCEAVETIFSEIGIELDVSTAGAAATVAKGMANDSKEEAYGALTQQFMTAKFAKYLAAGEVGAYALSSAANLSEQNATIEDLVAAAVAQVYEIKPSAKYSVSVVEFTTADEVLSYVAVAVAQ